jgi:hypothetical protein
MPPITNASDGSLRSVKSKILFCERRHTVRRVSARLEARSTAQVRRWCRTRRQAARRGRPTGRPGERTTKRRRR